jgi:hypothetical protein
MQNRNIIIIIIVLIVAGMTWWLYGQSHQNKDGIMAVNSYEDCIAAGYPVMDSYPEQCQTPEGETFVRDIGNENEKINLIQVNSPRPGATIYSPLTVSGRARGFWYFEASFPIEVQDENGNTLAQVPAQAQGEWMTEEFVPFEVIIPFTTPSSGTGQLILHKDNPSGLPENEDALIIPIIFGTNPDKTANTSGNCVITGCSGQICAAEEMVSTCEFQPEYSCYKTARCERNPSGDCAWVETAELKQCLANPPA